MIVLAALVAGSFYVGFGSHAFHAKMDVTSSGSPVGWLPSSIGQRLP